VPTASEIDVDSVVRQLEWDGICFLEGYVVAPLTRQLNEEFDYLFAHDLPGTRSEPHPAGRCKRILPERAGGAEFPGIRQVFGSPVLKEVALRYLPPGSSVNKDIVLTHETRNVPITDNHFDTVRALKFLLYLLDTEESNGAFRYAPGTHLLNAEKRKRFLRFGNRVADLPNVLTEQEAQAMQTFGGPAGTLIIFDTEGTHSGGVVADREQRKIIRSRSLFANQPELRPKKYSRQWFWEHRLNPLRLFAPHAPPDRMSTGGRARA